MDKIKEKSNFWNKSILKIAGILLMLFAAVILLWHGNVNSSQADMAMIAQVYFDGEYRIADGEWQQLVEGKHIPSTKGDVTLRGNFHMRTPDGEYVGVYSGDMPIALYIDHINLTFYENENDPYVMDIENTRLGKSACGVAWIAHVITSEEPMEIQIHNPHRFGNETAIDDLLSNMAFWTGVEFENSIVEKGKLQRDIGLMFMVISLIFLGSALFSRLIHIKNSKILCILGIVIWFAGTYFIYDTSSISFWSKSIVSNTTILGCSMMFYMLFLSVACVHFLKITKMVGTITVCVLGLFNTVLFLVPVVTDVLFYDTWFYWAEEQTLVSIILIVCLVSEFLKAKGNERYLYMGLSLPLVSFSIDFIMIGQGFWNNAIASKYIFAIFFTVTMITILKVIPSSINAVAKAKELENEKNALNAELAESRVAIMMSQIRPYFIYNTLDSIEQLCKINPKKATELVHNFAKYLRGNFRELGNIEPILLSQEMEHVRYYVSIENLRFPDVTFLFEMNASDFYIPALTIQPIVENAIKHGLMKLQKGGTIRIVSYETDMHYCVLVEDDGVGFDTNVLLDERKYVGIRNIQGRLKVMVNGTLSIDSIEGVGTKVLISIPKEAAACSQ